MLQLKRMNQSYNIYNIHVQGDRHAHCKTPPHCPIEQEHKWNLLCLEDRQEKLWLKREEKLSSKYSYLLV